MVRPYDPRAQLGLARSLISNDGVAFLDRAFYYLEASNANQWLCGWGFPVISLEQTTLLHKRGASLGIHGVHGGHPLSMLMSSSGE